MGTKRGPTNQMREKCVGLKKSGNGYKKIATRLKMHTSTVRAYLSSSKQLERLQTCQEEDLFTLPPRTARRMMIRGKIKEKRITAQSSILGSSSLQNYHYTSPPCQQMIWKACQKKSLSCHFPTNVSAWSAQIATGTVFYGQMK